MLIDWIGRCKKQKLRMTKTETKQKNYQVFSKVAISFCMCTSKVWTIHFFCILASFGAVTASYFNHSVRWGVDWESMWGEPKKGYNEGPWPLRSIKKEGRTWVEARAVNSGRHTNLLHPWTSKPSSTKWPSKLSKLIETYLS